MTNSTTLNTGNIVSQFLTAIENQKVNFSALASSIKDPLISVSNSNLASLVNFVNSYVNFLNQYQQYSSASQFNKYNMGQYKTNQGNNIIYTYYDLIYIYGNTINNITNASFAVLDSIYFLEGQEIQRIVSSNPALIYQGGSQLYQNAYSINANNFYNQLISTSLNKNINYYQAYKLREAYNSSITTYNYLKAFVNNYSLTSQIDSMLLDLQNYPDGNSNAVSNLLNAEYACVSSLSGAYNNNNNSSNSINNPSLNNAPASYLDNTGVVGNSNNGNSTQNGPTFSIQQIFIGILVIAGVCAVIYIAIAVFWFENRGQYLSPNIHIADIY